MDDIFSQSADARFEMGIFLLAVIIAAVSGAVVHWRLRIGRESRPPAQIDLSPGQTPVRPQ